MLVNAPTWIADTFGDPRPDIRTVKKWFSKNLIRGQMVEGRLFVETEDTFMVDKDMLEKATRYEVVIPEEHKLHL